MVNRSHKLTLTRMHMIRIIGATSGAFVQITLLYNLPMPRDNVLLTIVQPVQQLLVFHYQVTVSVNLYGSIASYMVGHPKKLADS